MPPKWERVAEAIREMIRSGQDLRERTEDDQIVYYLPAYPELLERRWPDVGKVSYGTLRHVIVVLQLEGWVQGEQGIGQRVRADHPE